MTPATWLVVAQFLDNVIEEGNHMRPAGLAFFGAFVFRLFFFACVLRWLSVLVNRVYAPPPPFPDARLLSVKCFMSDSLLPVARRPSPSPLPLPACRWNWNGP